MNARLQLTDMERAQCRKSVLMDKRADVSFVLEAMQESPAWHKSLISGDAIETSRAIEQAIVDYCDLCDYFEEAERDLLAAIERSGGRKLA